MDGILVGCGQITWNQFMQPNVDRAAAAAQILSEIAQAGYEGAPAGPRRGKTPEEIIDLYAKYGLKPAPGYLGADFWDPDQQVEILERAGALARFMRAVGCTETYIAASGFNFVTPSGKTRRQVAGHVGPDDGLNNEQYQHFAEMLNRVGDLCLKENVRICFHNHVGSVIETREEIDRLFSLVDRDLVFMGPDTGHLAWGGVDVVEFCRDYADSIKTMHLKDIDPAIMQEGREKEWDYGTFSDQGVFAELGEGFIDFPTIINILHDVGFKGWLITETDLTQKPTALESVTISREYLKSLGI